MNLPEFKIQWNKIENLIQKIIPNYVDKLDYNFKAILSDDETNIFQNFNKINKYLRKEDYYSYIKSLSNFSCFNDDYSDVKRAFFLV